MKRMRGGVLMALAFLAGCDGCNDGLQRVTPQGVLDPSVFNFGVVRAGATCTATVKLINRGGQELTTTGANFNNDNSGGAFSVLTLPPLVETANEAELTVQYAPTAESNGLHVATMVIVTNDPDEGGAVKATVSGEATSAAAGKILPRCKLRIGDGDEQVPCLEMDFGSTPKLNPGDQGGLSRTLTVTNDGTAPFNILAVNVLPVDGATEAPEFVVDLVNDAPPSFPVEVQPARSGDCGEPVENPAGIPVSIQFRPTRVGIQAAKVQIITDAFTTGTGEGAQAGQSNITIQGVGSGVGLGIVPEFVAFGSVAAGSSQTEPVVVSNLDVNQAAVNTTCIDINGNGTCYSDVNCMSGCTPDPEDVECTGGDADPATGLDCDVVDKGKGFILSPTDAAPGGGDEATINVTWAPTAAASFSKDLLIMSTIAGNQVYAVRLTGGVAGRISADTTSVVVPASADAPGATGSASFTISNTGMADLIINRVSFQGAPSISDDFTMTRDGDAAFMMGCTREANEMFCEVPDHTTPITLAPNASTTFNLAYADNDPAVAADLMNVSFSHNGNGGNPFTVDVTVCKPAGGSSNRPTCP